MYRAILVEDEPILRRGLLKLVPWEEHGFSLIGSASNGAEALSLIERLRPHLVVSDIHMPEMDGLLLTRMIRDRGHLCEIIFLTGFTDFEYAQSALRLGAADYVLKLKMEEDLPIALSRAREALDARGAQADSGIAGPLSPAERVRQYVEVHYADDLTLSNISDELGYNASYLSAAFAKEAGMTYTEYLTSVRMEHARALLTVPGVRIADVAERVGYPDVRNFGRSFKQRVGVTPAEYREGHRPGDRDIPSDPIN